MLTLKQASARIGVAISTLRMQAKRGVLRATLMGTTYVVAASEVDRYARENKGKPGRKKEGENDNDISLPSVREE